MYKGLLVLSDEFVAYAEHETIGVGSDSLVEAPVERDMELGGGHGIEVVGKIVGDTRGSTETYIETHGGFAP